MRRVERSERSFVNSTIVDEEQVWNILYKESSHMISLTQLKLRLLLYWDLRTLITNSRGATYFFLTKLRTDLIMCLRDILYMTNPYSLKLIRKNSNKYTKSKDWTDYHSLSTMQDKTEQLKKKYATIEEVKFKATTCGEFQQQKNINSQQVQAPLYGLTSCRNMLTQGGFFKLKLYRESIGVKEREFPSSKERNKYFKFNTIVYRKCYVRRYLLEKQKCLFSCSPPRKVCRINMRTYYSKEATKKKHNSINDNFYLRKGN
ncbi:hypothetical protein HUJ04_000637 [Dendroctonus ponderosae]|nr:hypothetical protein HUJ04_000637 [Dendroctonus ponderosae]